MPPQLEIAVQSVADLEAARLGGADRVELCQALGMGGLTPSHGLIAACVRSELPVHVLIRPRAGGYRYLAEELDVQVRDMAAAAQLGAAGVVVGAVGQDGALDVGTLGTLARAAAGLDLTFHRAFDVLPDPFAALDQLIDLGFRRVLTSGGAARAGLAIPQLARLVERAAGRIEVQAGGGVRIEDIPTLVAAGVDAIHLSARQYLPDSSPAGPGGGTQNGYDTTDPDLVRAARAAIG
jgi:copper homeostasis protein